MKNILSFIKTPTGSFLSIALIAAVAAGIEGCSMFNPIDKTTVTQGTNTFTVITVNTNNLNFDTGLFQSAVTTTVLTLLNSGHNNNTLLPDLQIAQSSLGGILNGVSTNQVSSVIAKLKANPALALQVNGLLKTASALEQKYLVGLDANAYAYVTHEFAAAAYQGLTAALPPQ